ncbi:hypothetical protein [Rhodobaculum claviforme]|uniref:Uncharacterized protein n=1 Tax=Rhodobaculum claviforme TaxID=1549854 RepID=A0A934THV6_9RHOB|nr:hypothetical protein [Rhodobaculum claviforme]MBK5925988.1 hypothetical protein [Rhodobaculum claviforme]
MRHTSLLIAMTGLALLGRHTGPGVPAPSAARPATPGRPPLRRAALLAALSRSAPTAAARTARALTKETRP